MTQAVWGKAACDLTTRARNKPQTRPEGKRSWFESWIYYLLTMWPASNFSTFLRPTSTSGKCMKPSLAVPESCHEANWTINTRKHFVTIKAMGSYWRLWGTEGWRKRNDTLLMWMLDEKWKNMETGVTQECRLGVTRTSTGEAAMDASRKKRPRAPTRWAALGWSQKRVKRES